MENLNKVKISYNFIWLSLLSLVGALFSLELIEDSGIETDTHFKEFLEYKIFMIAFLVGFVYLVCQPNVYYDDVNLYIKKLTRKEMSIPLKNIRSIFKNPLSEAKGGVSLIIEYIDITKVNKYIKFRAPNPSDKISDFITLVKKINSRVEIV